MDHGVLANRIRERLFALPDPAENRITESDLVRWFGVSRTPIREALKQLEFEGLVERRQNRGISLRRPSLREVAEVYDMRSVLEGFAGRLVVERARDEDIAALAELAKLQADEVRRCRPRRAGRVDQRFHHRIVVLSGNQLLRHLIHISSLQKRTFLRWHGLPVSAKALDNPNTHELIVEAFQARDADAAERVIRGHVQWAKQHLIEDAMGFRMDQFASPGGDSE